MRTDKIRIEKLQFDINREAAVISAFLSVKNKYKYLSGEEILVSDQKRMTERARFTYFPLGKSFVNKNFWESGKITSWIFIIFRNIYAKPTINDEISEDQLNEATKMKL